MYMITYVDGGLAAAFVLCHDILGTGLQQR